MEKITPEYLTTGENIGGGLGMATYGGKVNTLSPEATASAQRDCILDVACNAGWGDPKGEAPTLARVRNFYKHPFHRPILCWLLRHE